MEVDGLDLKFFSPLMAFLLDSNSRHLRLPLFFVNSPDLFPYSYIYITSLRSKLPLGVILGVIFSASLNEAFAVFRGCNFFADFHSDDNNDEKGARISFFIKQ